MRQEFRVLKVETNRDGARDCIDKTLTKALNTAAEEGFSIHYVIAGMMSGGRTHLFPRIILSKYHDPTTPYR